MLALLDELSIMKLFSITREIPPLNEYQLAVACVLGLIYGLMVVNQIKKCHETSWKITAAIASIIALKPVNDCILILSSTGLGFVFLVLIFFSVAKKVYLEIV